MGSYAPANYGSIIMEEQNDHTQVITDSIEAGNLLEAIPTPSGGSTSPEDDESVASSVSTPLVVMSAITYLIIL